MRIACMLIVLAVVGATTYVLTGTPGRRTADADRLRATEPGAIGHEWPPQVGIHYPPLRFANHRGESIDLVTFRGKVVLVESVGMSCGACQAFSGGAEFGGFDGGRPQKNLGSIAEYLSSFGNGVSLDDPRLVFVQILFYDMKNGAPTVRDARAWAEHFGLDRSANHHVLVGTRDYMGSTTHRMIPGFHLIDKDGVLRYDASGRPPRHDLYRELLPAVASLLAE